MKLSRDAMVILDVVFGKLMELTLNLSTAVPNKHQLFSELHKNQLAQLNAIKASVYSPEMYFTGNGPKATKYKEYLEMLLDSDTISKVKAAKFQKKIDAFNYNPDLSKSNTNAFPAFVSSVLKALNSIKFSPQMNFPKIKQDTNIYLLDSGIYSDDAGGDSSIILHLKATDTFPETVMYVRSDCSSLFVGKHVEENAWIDLFYAGSRTVFFDGLYETLEKELKKVIENSKKISDNYVFDAHVELEKIKEKAKEVFNNFSILPFTTPNIYRPDVSIVFDTEKYRTSLYYVKEHDRVNVVFISNLNSISRDNISEKEMIDIVTAGNTTIDFLIQTIQDKKNVKDGNDVWVR